MLLIPILYLAQSVTTREPIPYRTIDKMPDVLTAPAPSQVRLSGWLGKRVDANETHRLLNVDLEPLLAGYRQKPGSHPWIGEHIGKWLHAATLAWSYTGDPKWKAKLDKAVRDLIATQEPDGYLGTYEPGKRFGLYEGADWDVWSHKYNLIGLLTYYQYTGDSSALNACRRMGDLLIGTFGPGKKSILSAGTHMGMAATSVLEPIVLLYRDTKEPLYLKFAEAIVKSWDEPNGPRILNSLLRLKRVDKTANGKAYEMLSNLVGLCELARVTGNGQYLQAVKNAWSDITAKRLYLTGSASTGEHFPDDFVLPNLVSDSIAETCVTVTWIQLNLELLRLTGAAQFGNELEKSFYNHLAAAQDPKGDDWCYYTPLQGQKPYDKEITCCHSSGPRGMALAPTSAYLTHNMGAHSTLFVNTYESSQAQIVIHGSRVHITQTSAFPLVGTSQVRIQNPSQARFALAIRSAPWAGKLLVRLNGHLTHSLVHAGWLSLPVRQWRASDQLDVRYSIHTQVIAGSHSNSGTSAVSWGPYVMAYDAKMNPKMPTANQTANPKPAAIARASASGSFELPFRAISLNHPSGFVGKLVPFADAGSTGGTFRVWLSNTATGTVRPPSLFEDGRESRSRNGNVSGSILSDDPEVFVVTFDNKRADLDWFAVESEHAKTVARIEFVNGHLFHDGGWFDASKGKPVVEVQRSKDGPWMQVGELTGYPNTTSENPAELANPSQRSFILKLPSPIKVFGVRVTGHPASGDRPEQSFASCAALRGYGK